MKDTRLSDLGDAPEIPVINYDDKTDGVTIGLTLLCVEHAGKNYGLAPVMLIKDGKMAPAFAVETPVGHYITLFEGVLDHLTADGLPADEALGLLTKLISTLAERAAKVMASMVERESATIQ